MTKIMNATEDEAAKLALEGDAIILGGVEVHMRFVRYKGDPCIQVEYTHHLDPMTARIGWRISTTGLLDFAGPRS